MKHSGQTLIEGIAAVFIIVVGIVGALMLAVSAMSASKESEDQVMASNLAREGIEVIRNKRDSNWLAGSAFDTGLGLTEPIYYVRTNFSNGNWLAEPVSLENFFDPQTCSPTCQLYRNSTTGVFSHDSQTPNLSTNFYRVVQLNNFCRNPLDLEKIILMAPATPCEVPSYKVGLQVVAKVVWQEKNQIRSLILEDRLFDWK